MAINQTADKIKMKTMLESINFEDKMEDFREK